MEYSIYIIGASVGMLKSQILYEPFVWFSILCIYILRSMASHFHAHLHFRTNATAEINFTPFSNREMTNHLKESIVTPFIHSNPDQVKAKLHYSVRSYQ
jgi:hypothetical protein